MAFVGRTGSGKTFSAKGAAELVLREGGRVCIVDPTGVWFGMKSNAKGTGPGFQIVVFGGDHADVPIVDTSGAALAELVAVKNVPTIIDLSEFTIGGRTRFATRFLEDLYRRNRGPLTLIVDEADVFAPQKVQPDESVMLSRMEQICRRGRVRGFRPWLITQRPASLNKNVLSQANTLIAMQLTSPQDRKAIGAWIEGQADVERGKEVLAELPRLKRGEAFVWAPTHGILERVKFPAISTYDTGRAPVEGETPPVLKLAEIDLTSIGESFKQAEAEAAANDPKRLRARIAELERALKKADIPRIDQDEVDAIRREGEERGRAAAQNAFQDAMRERLRITRQAVHSAIDEAFQSIEPLRSSPHQWMDEKSKQARKLVDAMTTAGTRVSGGGLPKGSRIVAAGPAPAQAARAAGNGAGHTGGLPRGEAAILAACIMYPDGVERRTLTVLTGYKRSSRDAYVQRLREKGLVETTGDRVIATAAGGKALPDAEPLPTGQALQEYWLGRLPKGERDILEVLLRHYPRAVDRDTLTTTTGFARSTRDAYLQRLSAKMLVEPLLDGVAAAKDLFE
jgi:uncharacterized protein